MTEKKGAPVGTGAAGTGRAKVGAATPTSQSSTRRAEPCAELLGIQRCAAGTLYLFRDVDSGCRLAYTNRDFVDLEVGVGA